MVKPPNGAPSDWQSTVSEQQAIQEAKSLICEICRNFYQHGWVSGTGGGMSIKVIFPNISILFVGMASSMDYFAQ